MSEIVAQKKSHCHRINKAYEETIFALWKCCYLSERYNFYGYRQLVTYFRIDHAIYTDHDILDGGYQTHGIRQRVAALRNALLNVALMSENELEHAGINVFHNEFTPGVTTRHNNIFNQNTKPIFNTQILASEIIAVE